MRVHIRRRFLGAATAAAAGLGFARASAAAAQYEYKFAHNRPIESPLHVRATQMWNAVAQETGGRLVVTLFPNSVLGNETQMLAQLRSGALQFFSLSGISLSPVVPVSAIESVPFAFKDATQAFAALDGTLGAYIRQEIGAAGIYAFARPTMTGFYQITNSVRPIRSADDLDGLKIRTAVAKISVDTFKSLGASPTPISFAEVYTALQTHIVDGQYNPADLIETSRFFEVQKYLSMVNLLFAGGWMMANKDAWAALPPDIQGVVERNVAKYALLQRHDSALFAAASADKLQRQGMLVNVADAASFRAKLATGFYQRWSNEFGSKAWSLLESYTGKLG